MRRLQAPDRRGDSIIIGYVILIALAIGMASAVYVYLKSYLPHDQPKCPEGVSLIIREVHCNEEDFNITLTNKGVFSIDGAFVKIGEKGRVYKELLNCPDESNVESCEIYFRGAGFNIKSLKPGDSWFYSTDEYTGGAGEREVEIEPIVLVTNASRMLCGNAIVTQIVTCS